MLSPSITKTSFRDCVEPRPPTPPKDVSGAVDDAISFLDDSHEVENALKARFATNRPQQGNTPEPSSSPQRNADNCNTASKRVDFSSTPVFHEPIKHFHSPIPHLQSRVRSITDVKSSRTPRSILKPSQPLLPPSPEELAAELYYFSPEEPGSFMKMLHSVIRSLASSRQDQRLDAYLTLNGTLQQYDGSAEIKAMAGKMGIMTQFLARDMAWKQENGSLDVNIVQQALKLTAAIISNPNRELGASVDHDFRNLILDRSILMLETEGTPKAIIKLHLFLVSIQKFPLSNMTDARANQILTCLQTIEQRVSGNSAIVTKLGIYHRLLDQCSDVMLRRTQDWFDQVLHCLLSNSRDIRQRALEVCTHAGLTLGADSHFSRTVRRLLEAGHGEEGSKPYYHFFCEQLVQMYQTRQTAPYVPMIWAAIVLCFRNKREPIGSWPRFFKSWLAIIQKCLNTNDIVTKTQAVIAWNKFVFAIMPDHTSVMMLPMLKTPPMNMFEKKTNDKVAKQTRELAMNSFCNLLHYTMRPGLSHEELDQAWDIGVAPVFHKLLQWTGKGRINTCHVLKGLLTSKSGLWNVNIANENGLMTPADLPHIDARWVRLRLSRIVAVLEPILQDTMWAADGMSTEAMDATMAALFTTIAEAASQEIKTSNELKQAIASLTNLFHRLWLLGLNPLENNDLANFYNRYNDLLSNAVQLVGSSAFAEDILVRNNNDNGLEPASTPSSRPSKTHSVPHAPLVSLFGLLYCPSSQFADPSSINAFSALALNILDLLTSTKQSPPAKLDLLSRSMRLWNALYSSTAEPRVVQLLWRNIAEHTSRILQDDHQKIEKESSQKLGHELRHAQEILTAGLVHVSANTDCLTVSCSLLNAMMDTAKQESGAGGVVLAVVEPFAKSLLATEKSMPTALQLHFVTEVLLNTTWPKTRQDVEESKFALWNSTFGPQKRGIFEPFEHLYTLLTTLSTQAYETGPTESADLEAALGGFFDALPTFVSACPISLLAVALRRLQSGFAVWAEDRSRKAPAGSQISNKVCKFWHKLLAALQNIPQKDSQLLAGLDSIFVAGLSSPRKAIVNETILFWNKNFGSLEKLEYPKRLEAVLRARSMETELLLPSLSSSGDDFNLPNLPSLFESQEDDPLQPSSVEPSPEKHRARSTVPESAPTKHISRLLSFSPLPRAVAESSPARPAARSLALSTPKAKLRHDDSQIQFAHIDADSSPIRLEETQNLTEHQKEVTERQKQDASMYPELSSSPINKPKILPRSLQKRLAFLSHPTVQEEQARPIPEDHVDIGNMPTDEIPSSPTPSSAKGSDYSKHLQDDDTAEGDHNREEQDVEIDPPSSPPQLDDDEAALNVDHEQQLPGVEVDSEAVNAMIVTDETTVFDEPMSDTPDDVRQLRMEEEAAHSQQLSQQVRVDVPQPRLDNDVEVSVVEGTVIDSQESQAEPSDTPRSRKRKRKSKVLSSSKKRKALDTVPSSDAYEMEGDIGDEIIVAGSQNRPSPEPESSPTGDLDSADDATPEVASTPQSRRTKAKRRKRKANQRGSVSSPSTVIEATFAGTRSRQSPAISPARQCSLVEVEASESRVEDSQVAKDNDDDRNPAFEIVQSDQAETPPNSSAVRRRTLVAVVPTPPKKIDATPLPTFTPTSLLARLQDVLADLPSVTLNAMEDRQFRRVLNQLVNGVYEARERGLGE